MPGTFSRSLKIIKIPAPSPAIPCVGLVNTKSRGRIDSHFASATRCWLPPDSGMTVVSVPCGLILSHFRSWLTTAPSVCRGTHPASKAGNIGQGESPLDGLAGHAGGSRRLNDLWRVVAEKAGRPVDIGVGGQQILDFVACLGKVDLIVRISTLVMLPRCSAILKPSTRSRAFGTVDHAMVDLTGVMYSA